MQQEVQKLLRTHATSRRQFVRASAIAGGLMAAGQFLPSTVAGLALGRAAAQDGDAGVLNFALTLEHFEAKLYEFVISSGLVTNPMAMQAVELYGEQEKLHVQFLTAALTDAGATPVKAQASYKFPSLDSQQAVLETLAAVEDVGASAYLGAAPMIKNDTFLEAAIRIHSVEAYHASGIRFLAFGAAKVFPDFGAAGPQGDAFADPRTVAEVTSIVADFGVMPGMPSTGSGGTAENMGKVEKLIGVAGVGAAAAAGVGLVKNRAGATERE